MKTKSIANEILLQETAQLIAEGHTVTHIVRGNSMNPFLVDRRDKVVLTSFSDTDLKPGAFILARTDVNTIVLHRIVHRQGNELILMGDGNIKLTEQSSVQLVMGLVSEVVRKEKTYLCTKRFWKVYSWIWVKLLPLRRVLLGIWR